MLLNDNSNFLRYKTHKRQFHLKNSPDYSLRSTNTSPINMICIAHRKNCNITTDLKTTKAKNLENPGRNSSIWQNCLSKTCNHHPKRWKYKHTHKRILPAAYCFSKLNLQTVLFNKLRFKTPKFLRSKKTKTKIKNPSPTP